MISTADLDATVDACDLVRFRALVGDLIESSLAFRECEHIRAMECFYHAPSRDNLRLLLVEAWPLFTIARHFRA